MGREKGDVNKDDGNEFYSFQPQWNTIALIEKEFPKTLRH
jgi:hypothetical protein